MWNCTRVLAAWGAVAFAICAPAQSSHKGRAVLLISIDGLRPDYVLGPEHADIKVPHLRQLAKEGVYASGVRGVLPTVTFASHTTIVTGVYPARHGIESNHPFEPVEKDPNAWYWFAEDIRVPTLWDAAAHAGYTVASISWPVTVGARSIRFNIPEYAGTRTDQDLKMIRSLAGPALMAELGEKAGVLITDVDEAIARDWSRTRYAIQLIRQKHANFLALHLAASDHEQHASGPFTGHAIAAIEEIDKMLGELIGTIRAADPGAAVCVVSDHGFATVDHVFKLDAALVRAGLIQLKSQRESLSASTVASWETAAWVSGGSAAIMLQNPNDPAIRSKVRQALDALAATPENGIARILDAPAIAKMGGTPRAVFWLDMRPGYAFNAALQGPLVTVVSTRGTHGYAPDHTEMYSSFFLAGPGIKKGGDLGVIDMRAIAPTLASVMGASLAPADAAPFAVLAKPGAGR